MGDSDYSFSLTTFSPSGKLVQIEYALNAVNAGSTSLGIKGAARLLTRERGGAQGRPHGRGKGRGAANATASPLGSGAGWSFMGLRVPRLLRLLVPRHRAPALFKIARRMHCVWCVPRVLRSTPGTWDFIGARPDPRR